VGLQQAFQATLFRNNGNSFGAGPASIEMLLGFAGLHHVWTPTFFRSSRNGISGRTLLSLISLDGRKLRLTVLVNRNAQMLFPLR
jgi:hypothetical protein